jgi:plasmid stabilization system protein ParE
MKVSWTEKAKLSFNENIAYLDEKWNEAVVQSFIGRTEEMIEVIEKHPLVFPVINKNKGIHKCLVVKQVALYYRILEDRVDLIIFWNSYQNPNRLKF